MRGVSPRDIAPGMGLSEQAVRDACRQLCHAGFLKQVVPGADVYLPVWDRLRGPAGRFVKVYDSLVARLGREAAAVYGVVSDNTDSQGLCCLSPAEIAGQAGLSEQEVQDALRRLCQAGLTFAMEVG